MALESFLIVHKYCAHCFIVGLPCLVLHKHLEANFKIFSKAKLILGDWEIFGSNTMLEFPSVKCLIACHKILVRFKTFVFTLMVNTLDLLS